jgi:hypothetical protein
MKTYTGKQVAALVFVIVGAIAFVETSAPMSTGTFWREFLLKLIGYGFASEIALIGVGSFWGVAEKDPAVASDVRSVSDEEIAPLSGARIKFCGIWRRQSPVGCRVAFFLADGSRVTLASDGAVIYLSNEKPGDYERQGFVFDERHGSSPEPNAELRSLYLRLWTKATNQAEYEKSEWTELGRYLDMS